MHLGVFRINIWGHPESSSNENARISCLDSLGTWPQTLILVVSEASLAPFLCPPSPGRPPRGRRRSEVASCSSPSKQQRNSLDWLFSNPLPVGCLCFLWELNESHLCSAFGPCKPWGLRACACQVGGARVQLQSADHMGWDWTQEDSQLRGKITDLEARGAAPGASRPFPVSLGVLAGVQGLQGRPSKEGAVCGVLSCLPPPGLREDKPLFRKPSSW